MPQDRYQVSCNGAVWSGTFTLADALRRIGDLASRLDAVTQKRDDWHIRIVKIGK